MEHKVLDLNESWGHAVICGVAGVPLSGCAIYRTEGTAPSWDPGRRQ